MKKSLLILATVTCFVHCGLSDKASSKDRYIFAKSGISIPKRIGTLKLVQEIERKPDGMDVQVRYYDPKRLLKISLYVYQSPPGTKGPSLLLDSDGNKILEDREEMIKLYHAVFKLTDPSESFSTEFRRILRAISALGYKLRSEYRFMAVPKRDDSPIAYAATLVNTEKIEDCDVRMLWKTYLYAIPGYFVKIHCTYPEPLWREIGAIDVDFIQSINWNEVLPKRRGK